MRRTRLKGLMKISFLAKETKFYGKRYAEKRMIEKSSSILEEIVRKI